MCTPVGAHRGRPGARWAPLVFTPFTPTRKGSRVFRPLHNATDDVKKFGCAGARRRRCKAWFRLSLFLNFIRRLATPNFLGV